MRYIDIIEKKQSQWLLCMNKYVNTQSMEIYQQLIKFILTNIVSIRIIQKTNLVYFNKKEIMYFPIISMCRNMIRGIVLRRISM